MKKTFTVICAIALASLCTPQSLWSQDSTRASGFIRTPLEDAKILKANKPADAHTPQVPQFILKSKGGDFIMAVGGYINTIMGWDIGNNLYKTDAGISYIPAMIPIPAVRGQKADYYINPISGAIDFQFIGFPGTKKQLMGYVKLSTSGNNLQLCINKMYMTYKGLSAGLRFTLMQDGGSCPLTIDPQGPCGCISANAYQLAYEHNPTNGLGYGIAIEQPTYYRYTGAYVGHDFPKLDGDTLNESSAQLCPDVPFYVQYAKGGNRVRLTGLVRRMAYRDVLKDCSRGIMGWGAMLSGNLNPWNPLTLYYQAAYGAGIANFLQDAAGLPLSYIPKDHKPGYMKASPMMGIVFGASIAATKKLQFNVMGSESRVWNVGTYYPDYKYSLYVNGNAFYNITPFISVAIEYIWGKHSQYGGVSANDSRLQTQIQFTL